MSQCFDDYTSPFTSLKEGKAIREPRAREKKTPDDVFVLGPKRPIVGSE